MPLKEHDVPAQGQYTIYVFVKIRVSVVQSNCPEHLCRRAPMEYQQEQPAAETMREKTLETVQAVEQKAKPYEDLFIKCKDDWVHHLAQALAFSSLMAFLPNSILAFSVFV